MMVSLDQFFHLYQEKYLNPATSAQSLILERIAATTIKGLHRCARALCDAGNKLIIDHVFQDESWLIDCVLQLNGLEVLFAGVRCPLAIAEEREIKRADRKRGTARSQFDHVHADALYDIEVDSSTMTVQQCVQAISTAHEKAQGIGAFDKLVRRYRAKSASGTDATG